MQLSSTGHVNDRAHASMVSKALCLIACLMLAGLAVLATGCGGSNGNPQENDEDATVAKATPSIHVDLSVVDELTGETLYAANRLEVPGASTVLSVLETTEAEVVVEENEYGKFVYSIDDIEDSSDQGVPAGGNAWIFLLNGEESIMACDVCAVADGDRVEWRYKNLDA